MFCEVSVQLCCVIVFFTVFADHRVKFLEISLTKIVEFNLNSIKECLCFLFDSLQSLLSYFAVESCNVDDLSIFVDVIPRS